MAALGLMNMDNNQIFLKGLQSIHNTATLKNGTVSVPDILAAFPGLDLSGEQIALIYDYLERENISLEDYEPHHVNTLEVESGEGPETEGEESKRELRILEMYQTELEAIPPLSLEEEERLVRDLLAAARPLREQAAGRLTEGNLRWVLTIARDHAGQGVPLPDLIQEGNLALWESIRDYEGQEPLLDRLEKDIKRAMKNLIRESRLAEKREDELSLLANRILETVQEMEEELNRPVTAEEISAKTGVPQARVETILRESAKAIRKEEH